MTSKITFEGDGPFHLPSAQQAFATGHHNNGVTLTFKALLGDRQRTHGLEAYEVQMTSGEARKLLGRLSEAIKESEGVKVPVFLPPSLSTATNAGDRKR
jgi:hypothetical protein